MTLLNRSPSLGIASGGLHTVNAVRLYERITDLARAQSRDITARIAAEDIKVITAHGRLDGPGRVLAGEQEIRADAILIATGALPRVLPGAEPDGERILTWRQLYDLTELPRDLIVVGSGVTGAEFASAYQALGSRVTLVSSRDRVLPQEDEDAANLIENVFRRSGMTVLSQVPGASGAAATGDSVTVTLADGRTVTGTHCLMTVGMVPRTEGCGLDAAGVKVDERGFIEVDRVSRTSVPGVYAAGDCTGVLMLASVAAMQGRIAMWHALGESVHPIRLGHVAATIFTDPEIATVGVSQRAVDAGEVAARTQKLPLATNPRAKMAGFREGFVKLFTSPGTGVILGGVIVAPRASELILAVSVAMEQRLTAEQLAQTFTVYPSLSGSVTEAARKLMEFKDLVPNGPGACLLNARGAPGRDRRGPRARAGAAGTPGCRRRTARRCPRCRAGTAPARRCGSTAPRAAAPARRRAAASRPHGGAMSRPRQPASVSSCRTQSRFRSGSRAPSANSA